MQKLWHIAAEEILTQIREWAFYLTAVGMPLVFAAIGMLPQLQAMTAQSPLGQVETVFSESAELSEQTGYVDLANRISIIPPEMREHLQPFVSEAAAAQALSEGTIVRYYVIAADYADTATVYAYSDNPELLNSSDGAIRDLIRQNTLSTLNNPDLAARLETPIVEFDRGGKPEPPTFSFIPADLSRASLTLAGMVVALFSYLINTGGYLIIRSLKRETRAKILEVMVTSSTPGQFIGGKLAGLTILSIAQAALTLLAGAFVYGRTPNEAGPAALPLVTVGLILPYLLLGYLAYCGGIMSVAAVWPNLPESGTLLAMVRLLALSPIMGVVFILPQANSLTSALLTLNPWTGPLLMPFRLLITPVPVWQWGIGILGLIAWASFSIWLSTRLFRLNGLLIGRPPSWRVVWQAVGVTSR